MRKPVYAICKQQNAQISLRVSCADPCNLISAFAIHWLESILPLLSRSKIWRLASFCRWAGQFKPYLVETPKDRFSRDRAHFVYSLQMGRARRIWYLSPMRAAKVQASLRVRAVSPEPSLLAHTSSESSGTFRQKARSLAPLNGWACAVEICHDGMLEDTNSLDGAQIIPTIISEGILMQ